MLFMNGKFYSASEAYVLASDRGFLFGDGVFTTIRVANRQLEFFRSHCERFALHCSQLHISSPTIDLDNVLKLIELNDAYQGVWRLKIIATAKNRHEGVKMREVGSHIMILEPYEEKKAHNDSYTLWANPNPIATPFSRVKTLGCAARFFIMDEAVRHGCDEALLISPEGYVTETAFANFFWRLGADVFTPSPRLPLMSGIALMFAEMAAKRLGLSWHEVRVTRERIPVDAQLFICNSMKGIVPVSAYASKLFQRDHSFENALLLNYRELINSFSITC